MSNPGESAAARSSASSESTATTEPTFENKVNDVVKQMTKDENGVLQFPDNVEIDDSVKFAATTEKRRRDTESALGKTRLQLKTEEGLRGKLEKRVAADLALKMSPEAAEELELLQVNDPEAWRRKVNALEVEATTSFLSEQSTERDSLTQEAELGRRESVLAQFNSEHPDAKITDAVLLNEIPPRISKKLETGTITFEEFLTEANAFLTRPVKIAGTTAEEAKPNLGRVGGGSNPADSAVAGQDADDYSKTIF